MKVKKTIKFHQIRKKNVFIFTGGLWCILTIGPYGPGGPPCPGNIGCRGG